MNHAERNSPSKSRLIAMVVGTALASTALAGCTARSAPPASVSAGSAQKALAKGNHDQALGHAEAAVLAAPHDAVHRAMLGVAYMEAGRFQSATSAFQDARTLGDTSPRTALSLALAHAASGEQPQAVALLREYQRDLDPVDLGLALALAGEADRGVTILTNAVRGGTNTAKARQNLAYAYALQGNWNAARVMASVDVAGDQLVKRMTEWASMARPEQYQNRVASLLQVPVVGDAGQPHYLALGNNPGAQQLAAEAAAQLPMASAPIAGELPALGAYRAAPIAAPASPPEVAAFVAKSLPPLSLRSTMTNAPAPEPAAAEARNFANTFAKPAAAMPAVAARETSVPAVRNAARVQPVPAAVDAPVAKAAAPGTHLVQLGSFSTEASAKRAWSIYRKRYSDLDQYEMVITKAIVRGSTYYRVSAGGMGLASARTMCGKVKASGEGCLAWAEGKPLPGAVDNGTRMARR